MEAKKVVLARRRQPKKRLQQPLVPLVRLLLKEKELGADLKFEDIREEVAMGAEAPALQPAE